MEKMGKDRTKAILIMDNKQQLNDVALLRCFATISLVIWHTYCSYISWDVADTPLNPLYSNLFTSIIPDANMPLFTILAGYLFYFLNVEKRKYNDFKQFFRNKVNRLFIPFIILGVFINILEYDKKIIDLVYGLPNHMWYCLMLFYVYISFWVIEKYFGTKVNAIIALISFAVVAYTGLGALSHRFIGGLFLPVYYYGYFYVGFIVRKYKDWLLAHSKVTFSTAFVVFSLVVLMHNNHLIAVTSVAYFILLYILSNTKRVQVVIGGGKTNEIINTFSKYSFGVYVFHQWIIWNLTREPHCLNIVQPLLNEYYIIAPIIMFVSVLGISLLLTHLSLKTRVGKYLLL